MKDNNPASYVLSKVSCACGNKFEVETNTPTLTLEVCNKCHPYFTGKEGQTKKTGTVEKFNKKYNLK